jgi:hypothetical protein
MLEGLLVSSRSAKLRRFRRTRFQSRSALLHGHLDGSLN